MADAETAEVVHGSLGEGLRQQDLEAFVESLQWQAEGFRLARGLPDDHRLVTEDDADYFRSRYAGLRTERGRALSLGALSLGAPPYVQALDLHQQLRRLNGL